MTVSLPGRDGRMARPLRSVADLVENRPEAIFVLLAGLFGLVFAFTMPPLYGMTLDEGGHFLRAYQVSELTLVAQRIGPSEFDVGGSLPRGVVNVFSTLVISQIRSHASMFLKPNISQIRSLFAEKLDPKDRVLANFPGPALCPFVAYVPPALGIAVGRFLGLAPVALIYPGRVFSLAAYMLFAYAAIRVTPLLKKVFLMLALTPLSLGLAANLTGDTLTNAAGFLLVAYVLKCAYGPSSSLTRNDLVTLCALAALLLSCKQGCFPLCLLVLVIPLGRFGGPRRLALFAGAYVTVVIAAGVFVTLQVRGSWFEMPGATPADEKLGFILTHPWDYCRILLRTVAMYCSMQGFNFNMLNWVQSFIGCYVHRIIVLPWGLGIPYYTLLVILAVSDNPSQVRIQVWARFLMAGLFAAVVALTRTAMFLICTKLVYNKLGRTAIWGVQSRYFIPVAPLAFLCISAHFARFRRFHRVINVAVPCCVVLTLVSAVALQVAVDFLW